MLQRLATKSVTDVAEEAKQFYEPEKDGIFNIGVSGDGNWRKHGCSSVYGVVAALSTVTGKVLDAEVMSKECRECMGWRAKEGTVEFQEWWEGHPTLLPSQSLWFLRVNGCHWHAFNFPTFCGKLYVFTRV